ncbi:MAG: hypothetical protein H7Y88_03715 [Phycisphaerales bacterium]|nr:hypothetical protein [Phycisphaerales bacterium]
MKRLHTSAAAIAASKRWWVRPLIAAVLLIALLLSVWLTGDGLVRGIGGRRLFIQEVEGEFVLLDSETSQGDIASLIYNGAEIFEARLNLGTREIGFWVPVVERVRYALVLYYLGTTELPSEEREREVAAVARGYFLTTVPDLSSMAFEEWRVGGKWTRFDVDWWGVTQAVLLVLFFLAFLRTLPWLFIGVHRARAWPARRRLARGQCPFCGYDLSGAPSDTCPECGRDAGHAHAGVDTQRGAGSSGPRPAGSRV